MPSIREQIVQQVQRRCSQAIAPITVQRMPVLPVTREHSPALLLCVESDTVLSISNASVDRRLTIRLVALARGESGFAIVDDLIIRAHRVLMADANAGGLALGIHEIDAEWDSDDADDGVIATPARYAIAYRTLFADLTQLG